MQGIINEKYRAGINLGGWVSQCGYQKEHIAGFIEEKDIAQIASWGLDHIRLPFDYPILEDDAHPFDYHEEGFAVIDRLIAWSKKHKLNVVLDMHKAPGYAFYDNLEEQRLFTDEQTQQRFYALWRTFAKRYASEGDNVIFELMNEITDPRGDTWNQIARKAIEAIHEIDANRYLLLGGPHYNAASSLDALEIYENRRILYNFHFYEPFPFTHQRAGWTALKDTGIHQPYPGKVEGIEALSKAFGDDNASMKDSLFNKDFLREKLAPALAFMQREGRELYCGEYGAIDLADMPSRINWIRDVAELFKEYNIGRACWSYKGMGFTTIDQNGKPVSEALIQSLAM